MHNVGPPRGKFMQLGQNPAAGWKSLDYGVDSGSKRLAAEQVTSGCRTFQPTADFVPQLAGNYSVPASFATAKTTNSPKVLTGLDGSCMYVVAALMIASFSAAVTLRLS